MSDPDWAEGPALPMDRAAERACLSAIYARGIDALAEVHEHVVDPLAFTTGLHRDLYSAMVNCADADEVICAESIVSELRRAGAFERHGGMRAIEYLRSGVITRTAEYAEAVKRVHRCRSFHVAMRTLADHSLAESDVSVSIAKARRELDRLDAAQSSLIVTIREAVAETERELEKRESGEVRLVPTGLRALDAFGLLEQGDLVILAAPSGMGKTALAMSIARNAVLAWDDSRRRYVPVSRPIPVLFLSTEMGLTKLVMRWLSDLTGFDGSDLRSPQADWLDAEVAGELRRDRRSNMMGLLGAVEISMTRPSQVRGIDTARAVAMSWSARMRSKYGQDTPLLVFVDYLQRMDPPSGMPSNVRSDEREGEKAKALKSLAQDMNAPVIALSQVTEDKRTGEMGLRGSTAIFHEADRVWKARRPWKSQPDVRDLESEFQRLRYLRNRNAPYDRARFNALISDRNYVEIALDKTRDGAADVWAPVQFEPELTRFLDMPSHGGSDRGGSGYGQR